MHRPRPIEERQTRRSGVKNVSSAARGRTGAGLAIELTFAVNDLAQAQAGELPAGASPSGGGRGHVTKSFQVARGNHLLALSTESRPKLAEFGRKVLSFRESSPVWYAHSQVFAWVVRQWTTYRRGSPARYSLRGLIPPLVLTAAASSAVENGTVSSVAGGAIAST
jgi:hypothetical protein